MFTFPSTHAHTREAISINLVLSCYSCRTERLSHMHDSRKQCCSTISHHFVAFLKSLQITDTCQSGNKTPAADGCFCLNLILSPKWGWLWHASPSVLWADVLNTITSLRLILCATKYSHTSRSNFHSIKFYRLWCPGSQKQTSFYLQFSNRHQSTIGWVIKLRLLNQILLAAIWCQTWINLELTAVSDVVQEQKIFTSSFNSMYYRLF